MWIILAYIAVSYVVNLFALRADDDHDPLIKAMAWLFSPLLMPAIAFHVWIVPALDWVGSLFLERRE